MPNEPMPNENDRPETSPQDETEAGVDFDSVPTDTPDINSAIDPEEPTDDALYNEFINHPFVTGYLHTPKSETNPRQLIKMSDINLLELARKVRADIQDITMQKRHGLYKDKRYRFYTNLQNFITDVIKAKKQKSAK
jgi:hypothetical protein